MEEKYGLEGPGIDYALDDFIKLIFSEPPKEKNTNVLLIFDECENSFIFEILIHFTFSGLYQFLGPKQSFSDITSVEDDIIILLKKYVESIRYTLVVERFPAIFGVNESLDDFINNHIELNTWFARTVNNDMPVSMQLERGLTKRFFFMMNPDFYNRKVPANHLLSDEELMKKVYDIKLEDYYCIFFDKSKKTVYKASYICNKN